MFTSIGQDIFRLRYSDALPVPREGHGERYRSVTSRYTFLAGDKSDVSCLSRVDHSPVPCATGRLNLLDRRGRIAAQVIGRK